MKVFITGASGFVGHHLIDLLKAPEHIIFGACFPEEPESLRGGPEEKFFRVDIRSRPALEKLVKKIQPDHVFHLAAVSNVRLSWSNNKATFETNLLGTLNVFESIKKYAPEARILFVSSADVYGDSAKEGKPLCEEDPAHAASPYALTKVFGEHLSRFYVEREGLDIVISRSFPHTGPGQSADFVCSDWAFQIAQIEKRIQEPVVAVGDIDVHRDFSDVRDVVRAYKLLLEKGEKGHVYNVSSGSCTLLRDILDKLISFSKETINVRGDSRKVRKSEIICLQGDNSKIKEEIGWEPQIPLEKTLQDLLDYWRVRI